jgi:hypothetical protein
MPAGRPKGSTGTYSRWPPSRIAELLEDADIIAPRDGNINHTLVATWLREQHPKKYGYVDIKHLRQQLSRAYQHRNRTKTMDELDAFNADVLAHLLGEK